MDLEFPRGKFHQWHRLALAWTAAKDSGLTHSSPFVWPDDLVWHWTARVVFQDRLFEGEGGQDCPSGRNVALDLQKPLVEPHLQSNSDLLVGCFQSS